MPDNVRPHIVMGIIILVLALALITLMFIPQQVHSIQQPLPASSAQITPANQQTNTITRTSNNLLVIPLSE